MIDFELLTHHNFHTSSSPAKTSYYLAESPQMHSDYYISQQISSVVFLIEDCSCSKLFHLFAWIACRLEERNVTMEKAVRVFFIRLFCPVICCKLVVFSIFQFMLEYNQFRTLRYQEKNKYFGDQLILDQLDTDPKARKAVLAH